jgi:hypothetical protein
MSRRKQPLPKFWESSMRCYRELKTRPGLTKSFQADRYPRERGQRPLNTDPWARGASTTIVLCSSSLLETSIRLRR